jgi:hypothetical protein
MTILPGASGILSDLAHCKFACTFDPVSAAILRVCD